MNKEKYITVLNVIACIFVIILHSYTLGFEETTNWILERVIRGIAYCAVPIFFMISGATLIDYRDRYDTKTFFKKRFIKTLLPLLIWSIVYFIADLIGGKIDIQAINFKFLVDYFTNVRMNPIFWFFVVIIGIYLSIPVISLIPKESRQKTFLYIIVISFITISLLPFLYSLLGIQYNNDLRFPLTASGWIIFIFIGYYISHYEIKFKHRIIIYCLGLLGLLTFIVGTIFWSFNNHEFITYFEEYYNVPCLFYSIAFFLLFKNIKFESKGGNVIYKVCEFIAPCTLGIYIIHMLIRNIVCIYWGYSGFLFDTLLALILFNSSFIIVKGVKYIPYSIYLFP